MLHLPIERMAELVEGGATPGEREHLLTCPACTRELDAYRRLVTIAGEERRRIAPPLTDWHSISVRLRSEGLLAPPAGDSSRRVSSGTAGGARQRGSAMVDFVRRAAVVVVFVGGGAVLGRMSAGMPVMDAVALSSGSVAPVLLADSGQGATTRLASDAGFRFQTSQDALRALETAQRQYEVAATWLATHDTSSSELAPDQYRTRLAALDRTAETMQQAMHDAPSDPYINQYYLATLSAREQTLRRLGTTLPVGSRLGRF